MDPPAFVAIVLELLCSSCCCLGPILTLIGILGARWAICPSKGYK
ncbi:MAG: hypothetical protein QCI82_11820 [Candidatus Thermoplasmatota archaeon]|nr:hypothetical protein [Candidatus Thermoplasmatota archaeon]